MLRKWLGNLVENNTFAIVNSQLFMITIPTILSLMPMKITTKQLVVWMIVVCFGLSTSAFSSTDNTTFQAQDVDTPAEPYGGINQLTQFINRNLRIPLALQIAKVEGQVLVEATIDTLGGVTQIHVIKGLYADADQEAIRVVSLFKAWNPALKATKKVAQKVIIPVNFDFDSSLEFRNGQVVNYYDANLHPVNNKKDAELYSLSKVTNAGIPMGDIVFYRIDGDSSPYYLLKYEKIRLNREPVYGGIIADTLRQCDQVFFRNKRGRIEGPVYKFYPNGALFETEHYLNGKIVGASQKFYPNGLLGEEKVFMPNSSTDFEYFRWHPNGQLAEVSSYSLDGDDNFKMSYTLYNLWNEQGKLLVKEGDGQAIIEKYNPASKRIVEQGKISQGLKNGNWEGYKGKDLAFLETYDLGLMITAGYVDENGRLQAYKERQTPPRYVRGEAELATFISSKLKSTYDKRERIQLSFKVELDGTLHEIALVGDAKDKAFADDVIKILGETNGLWQPATFHGQPVAANHQMTLNISFK